MDDDDAAAGSPLSQSPSLTPTSSPLPIASALPTADPVTVAAAPPSHLLTLALPIQKPQPQGQAPSAAAGGHSGGGGREDAWSEGATSALIDAWGERFLALGRGSLRHPQWQEVADSVSSRDGYSKPPKSDVQCKNRIDTLKKKYKLEKGKPLSSWPFFHRLDSLLAPTYKPNNSAANASNPNPRMISSSSNPPPLRSHFPQRSRTPLLPAAEAAKRRPSPQPSVSSESSDGFPPEPPPVAPAANGKRRRVDDGEGDADRAQGLRELAQAIRRLGEAYERVERTKLEQAAAMERQRMEFARELEAQRVQFFLKTQMELSQVKNRTSGVPAGAAGGGTRRMAMVADVGTSSNHHGRYRVGDSGHRHVPQPHYQYNQNNATAGGNGGESDEEEEEEEESQ